MYVYTRVHEALLHYSIPCKLLKVSLCVHVYVHAGVAKMVFTKCVRNRYASVQGTGLNDITVKQVIYDFEFIEDYSETKKMKTESFQLMPTAHPYGLIQNNDDDYQDVCKPPLVPPSEYSPLYHPLTLMVYTLYTYACMYMYMYMGKHLTTLYSQPTYVYMPHKMM